MSRRADAASGRGYFGLGVERPKTEANIGTLWRSAYVFGAAFLFTVGRRYEKQHSDTLKTWRHVPLFHYETLDAMRAGLPHDCPIIGVELHESAESLTSFTHPARAAYLLGAEDHGLSNQAVRACHRLVRLRGRFCLNVAVAGSIVMHDRFTRTPE